MHDLAAWAAEHRDADQGHWRPWCPRRSPRPSSRLVGGLITGTRRRLDWACVGMGRAAGGWRAGWAARLALGAGATRLGVQMGATLARARPAEADAADQTLGMQPGPRMSASLRSGW